MPEITGLAQLRVPRACRYGNAIGLHDLQGRDDACLHGNPRVSLPQPAFSAWGQKGQPATARVRIATRRDNEREGISRYHPTPRLDWARQAIGRSDAGGAPCRAGDGLPAPAPEGWHAYARLWLWAQLDHPRQAPPCTPTLLTFADLGSIHYIGLTIQPDSFPTPARLHYP